MKNILFLLIFNLFTIFVFSQRMFTDKYEIYLLNIEESSINISKEMKMTSAKQYYYDGTIEVVYMNSGDSKKFNFFFSSWDDKYKEFTVKDTDLNIIKPQIFFKDKETAIIKKLNEDALTKLRDNSNIDNSILSSMIVWLDNQEE